ncbi:MAG: hypothetical protein QXP80_02580 [Zestosphaera sp.]
MVTAVVHVSKEGARVSIYDCEGKLNEVRDFSEGRRVVLDFDKVDEVRVAPYTFEEGFMIVIKGFKVFKALEVGRVEEAPATEDGKVEEPE